jgi:hypothetical protein
MHLATNLIYILGYFFAKSILFIQVPAFMSSSNCNHIPNTGMAKAEANSLRHAAGIKPWV